MNKNTIIIGLAIAVIGLGGYMYLKSKNKLVAQGLGKQPQGGDISTPKTTETPLRNTPTRGTGTILNTPTRNTPTRGTSNITDVPIDRPLDENNSLVAMSEEEKFLKAMEIQRTAIEETTKNCEQQVKRNKNAHIGIVAFGAPRPTDSQRVQNCLRGELQRTGLKINEEINKLGYKLTIANDPYSEFVKITA